MFRRFTAKEIERPFTAYCDCYPDKKVRKSSYTEIQFSGIWANCFGGEHNWNDESFELSGIVKITYTYYDWLKKRKVNQIIYKR